MIFSQKLQHELPCRFEKIETARTPLQKHLARQEGLSVRADLEKQISDDAALAAFKAAQPQSSFGVWKGLVHDRPVFMTGPAGTKITGPITLPDGSKAEPNPQGQIVVPMPLVPAMIARGFVRANSVITHLDTATPDPAHLQHVSLTRVPDRAFRGRPGLFRRGIYRSVAALRTDIKSFIELHNANPKPFRWTKSADDILSSIERFCAYNLPSKP